MRFNDPDKDYYDYVRAKQEEWDKDFANNRYDYFWRNYRKGKESSYLHRIKDMPNVNILHAIKIIKGTKCNREDKLGFLKSLRAELVKRNQEMYKALYE